MISIKCIFLIILLVKIKFTPLDPDIDFISFSSQIGDLKEQFKNF